MKIGNILNFFVVIALIFCAIKYGGFTNSKNFDFSASKKTNNSISEPNTNYPSKEKSNFSINPQNADKYVTHTIPPYVFEYSKKFRMWNDILFGSKVYIVYSYRGGSDCPAQSQQFHDYVANYAHKNYGYYVDMPISPDQLDNTINKGLDDLGNSYQKRFDEAAERGDNNTIKQLQEEINNDNEHFQQLIDFINACTLDTCLIDPQNRKYIKTDRDFNKLKNILDSYK